MLVSKEEILNIAKLAKLSFGTDELERMQNDMNEIIDYFNILNEADTNNILLNEKIKTGNILREDKPDKSLPTEEAMKNAPLSEGRYFSVPEVIKEK